MASGKVVPFGKTKKNLADYRYEIVLHPASHDMHSLASFYYSDDLEEAKLFAVRSGREWTLRQWNGRAFVMFDESPIRSTP